MLSWLSRLYETGYRLCYGVGVQAIRLRRFSGRRLRRTLRPVARLGALLLDWLLLRRLRATAKECRRFAAGFPIARARLSRAARCHPLLVVPQLFALPFVAVRRHRRLFYRLGNILAPVAALAVLLGVVQTWAGAQFGLNLEYEGQYLGVIAQESVFDEGALMAQGQVINADNSFEVARQPQLRLALTNTNTQFLDENAVAEEILKSSANAVAWVSGLYANEQFQGAVASHMDMDAMLESILAEYRVGGGAKERVEFVENVQIIDGLYPVSSLREVPALRGQLTALTVEGAPFLRVQTVRTETYTQPIPFTTATVKDTTKYIGYWGERTKGKDGVKTLTADVVYLDGVEQSRTVLEEVVTTPPVQQVFVEGGLKVNSSAEQGKPVGKFIWPVPGHYVISSPFGSRWGSFHQAIDISGGNVYGATILAADGGRVVDVNKDGSWGMSYGNYVLIDHGNGYKTMYAHMSSVSVSLGDQVTQGQMIGRVGATGRAYGAHLHFEIRLNGTAVNPAPYVNRK